MLSLAERPTNPFTGLERLRLEPNVTGKGVTWAKHDGAREVTERLKKDGNGSKLTENGRHVNPSKTTTTRSYPEREES